MPSFSPKTALLYGLMLTCWSPVPLNAAPKIPANLTIAEQGFFASGGSVTPPLPGDYDPRQNWLDPTRAGNTAHIDHASVFYQVPSQPTGAPVVFLHGYGQSRLCWMATPDGRPGWAQIFLKAGHPIYLVNQPRRGHAGATTQANLRRAVDECKPGDQAWYTHFRIGRVPPERYSESQFPEGPGALNQFLRQATPNTGPYDENLFGETLAAVLSDVRTRTGRKSVYITHSQGSRIGWNTPVGDIAAIIAIEPGGTPPIGGKHFRKLLQAKIPILLLFGDYIDNGPADIASTAFWRNIRNTARTFAKAYRAAGGKAECMDLPAMGIKGNSHFLFQERNNDTIARLALEWLAKPETTRKERNP
ncbi:MAG: alpha/beta fold hydrolase [Kiritimatiellia bacterium]